VVQFVFVLDPAQDADRVLDAGLVDEDRLEAPLQRGVLLDIFLVFVERGRADAMQLAAAERGLEQIARIHAALARAGADQRVHFVDEQDDLPFGTLHLVEHRLEPLLELAAVLRAGDKRAHVERHQRAALEAVGHIAIGNAQREAFGNRGLARAGFADERGIVLGPAREDLHGAADFLVAADHRVELAVARRLREVAGVFLHRVVAFFGARAVGGAATGDLLDRGLERLGIDPRGGQRLACRIVGQRERLQQALDGDEAVARLLGELFGLVERAHGVIVEPRRRLRSAARNRGHLGERIVDFGDRHAGVAAGTLDELRGHALLVVEQRLEQMRGRNPLVVQADRNGLCSLQEALGAVGEFLEIHANTPVMNCRPDMVLRLCNTTPPREFSRGVLATYRGRGRLVKPARAQFTPAAHHPRHPVRDGPAGSRRRCRGNRAPGFPT